MAKTNPLTWNVPIVDKGGLPTSEFMTKWQLQTKINAEIPALSTPAQVSAVLDIIGGTKGSLLVRDTEQWKILPPGDAGKALVTGGVGELPAWATLSANIQTLLDSISNVQGVVLYRSASGWEALAPGAAGQVLSTGGAGADPSWITPSGGGGAGTFWSGAILQGGASSTAYATKGIIIRLASPLKVFKIGFALTPVAGHVYQVTVAECSTVTPSAPITSIVYTGTLTAPATTAYSFYQMHTLSAPLHLDAGKLYCIVITDTSLASGSTALPLLTTSGASMFGAMPLDNVFTSASVAFIYATYFNTLVPAVGQSFITTGSAYCIQMQVADDP